MKKKKKPDEREVSPEVHDWLARNGKRGGVKTAKLIELGKEVAAEKGVDIDNPKKSTTA